MILDSLKNASAYLSLHPRFKQAFDFLQQNNLQAMEPGKIMLDGENLFVSIVELKGKKLELAKTEAHKKYIDIQVVISGQETMGWAAIENCIDESDSYIQEKDIIFYADKPSAYFVVNQGEFAIFFPEDAHAPAIGNGYIKKAIIKVLI